MFFSDEVGSPEKERPRSATYGNSPLPLEEQRGRAYAPPAISAASETIAKRWTFARH